MKLEQFGHHQILNEQRGQISFVVDTLCAKIYEVLLCKAVLAMCMFDTYFFICNVSRGLHYISLHALSLLNTLAHLWVPFSSGVSWNKRTSAMQSNKPKLLLHITQTESYL